MVRNDSGRRKTKVVSHSPDKLPSGVSHRPAASEFRGEALLGSARVRLATMAIYGLYFTRTSEERLEGQKDSVYAVHGRPFVLQESQ